MRIGAKRGGRWFSIIFPSILLLLAFCFFVSSKQSFRSRGASAKQGAFVKSIEKNEDPSEYFHNDAGNAANAQGAERREFTGEKWAGKASTAGVQDPTLSALPSCAKKGKAKSFLMVFMGHSGSTAILSELAQHPETYIKNPEPVDHNELQHDVNAALSFTDKFFEEGKSLNKIPGFKIRPRHILEKPAEWQRLVERHDTRIIWQFRENVFKQAIGEYSYRYLNDTSVIEGLRGNTTLSDRCKQGAGCHFRVHSMPYLHELLKTFVVNDKLITGAVRKLGREGCTLPLAYEEYLYHHDQAMSQTFQFLGLDSIKAAPSRGKATKDSLCQVLDNFDEICHTFYGCHSWRHMLTDAINQCKVSGSSPFAICVKPSTVTVVLLLTFILVCILP